MSICLTLFGYNYGSCLCPFHSLLRCLSYPFVCRSLSVCLSGCLPLCPPVCLSLSICLPVFLSPFVCISLCLSNYLSVFYVSSLVACLSLCLLCLYLSLPVRQFYICRSLSLNSKQISYGPVLLYHNSTLARREPCEQRPGDAAPHFGFDDMYPFRAMA